MSGLRVTRWKAAELPTESDLVQIMSRQGLDPYLWSNSPHDVYFAHKHDYHKVIYVVRGSIIFDLPRPKIRVELTAGDRLDLPAGMVHKAEVGAEGVVCLEGHVE
ncbi:MAG: hypothetical protein PHQ36_01225 [Anaerolineales bacterium]|nr:hypothetical protein [Anaerolineales bacterium]